MRWLIACLLVLCTVVPAMAGEDPFIAVVGNDILANPFYISPKHQQFLIDSTLWGIPIVGEGFTTDHTIPRFPEVCDIRGILGGGTPGLPFTFRGVESRLIGLQNSGWFQWTIALPKKPNAINICFECAVLKPNTFPVFHFEAVELCAANTGERQFPGGICARDDVEPGENPIIAAAQPQVDVTVAPGPNNAFTPFHLTAYRNPGTYNGVGDPMQDNSGLQVLNGRAGVDNAIDVPGTRIMLKSCLDKCINIKIPVTGQVNALTEVEEDLEMGDLITVRLSVPRANTVDIFCGAQSAYLAGIGEAVW